ncbi:MAG TPA: hypothetical protein DCL70_06690 [Kocuria sp.]|nr:hypothetical protein [Kocuria sp.]
MPQARPALARPGRGHPGRAGLHHRGKHGLRSERRTHGPRVRQLRAVRSWLARSATGLSIHSVYTSVCGWGVALALFTAGKSRTWRVLVALGWFLLGFGLHFAWNVAPESPPGQPGEARRGGPGLRRPVHLPLRAHVAAGPSGAEDPRDTGLSGQLTADAGRP